MGRGRGEDRRRARCSPPEPGRPGGGDRPGAYRRGEARGRGAQAQLPGARPARPILGRPLDWFLSPSPPVVVSRRKGRPITELSSADVLLENLGHDVGLLAGLGLLAPPPTLPKVIVDSVSSAERAASELRTTLRVAPGPVWELQAVAGRAGLHVFSFDLGNEALWGSYLRLQGGGVALVNGGHQTGRRRFTAVHELGHHVLADDFSTEWVVGKRRRRPGATHQRLRGALPDAPGGGGRPVGGAPRPGRSAARLPSSWAPSSGSPGPRWRGSSRTCS